MDKFQTVESFAEFYEPYLKNYCFDGTVFSNIIEKQKINPDKDFIQKAIKELRKTITNIIVNSTAHQNPQEDPSIMQYVYGFVEYSKLHKNQYPNIFVGTDNNNFDKFNYPRIGAFFAQGFIKKEKGIFYFKDETFKVADRLHERISEEIKKVFGRDIKPGSIKLYVSDTLSGKNTDKNFYKNETIHLNTVKFCEAHNIPITEFFLNILND